MRKLFTWLLCGAAALQVNAQSPKEVIMIDPAQTGPGINMVHSGHLAVYYPKVNNEHKLFLMIVGTGGSATDMITIDTAVASMGYHTLAIDYRNNVITTVCNNSPDSACFDKFRQEIMFGTPVSDSVNVDTANSIVNRVRKALQYLVKNDPDGEWNDYIAGNNIKWQNIIVGGHSQGAGHAAFIGKRFNVNRVLIFSGPQDYRVAFSSPASWLGVKGITNAKKYYAFLHIKDPFDFTRQLANCAKVMNMAKQDYEKVEPGVPLSTNRHILVNSIETNNAHGSTLLPQFKNVWEYMLKNENY